MPPKERFSGEYTDQDGNRFFYINGLLHRDIEPAVILINGDMKWYYHGELIKSKEGDLTFFYKKDPAIANGRSDEVPLQTFQRNAQSETPCSVSPELQGCVGTNLIINGETYASEEATTAVCQKFYRNGKLHNERGPAATYRSGREEWRIDGFLHRVEGPALICANGDKRWYVRGKLHREDGPAVEYANGDKKWYFFGLLHRLDGGPAVEYANGTREWRFMDILHRLDGPAVIKPDGTWKWYEMGIPRGWIKFQGTNCTFSLPERE